MLGITLRYALAVVRRWRRNLLTVLAISRNNPPSSCSEGVSGRQRSAIELASYDSTRLGVRLSRRPGMPEDELLWRVNQVQFIAGVCVRRQHRRSTGRDMGGQQTPLAVVSKTGLKARGI